MKRSAPAIAFGLVGWWIVANNKVGSACPDLGVKQCGEQACRISYRCWTQALRQGCSFAYKCSKKQLQKSRERKALAFQNGICDGFTDDKHSDHCKCRVLIGFIAEIIIDRRMFTLLASDKLINQS